MIQERLQPLDRDTVARALEGVFQRAELRPPSESWLDQQLRRLLASLPDGALPEAAAWIVLWVLAAVLGLMLGWILVQLRRHVRTFHRAPATSATTAVVGSVAAADRLGELRRRARAAREAGDLVLALRLSFAALLVGLGRRGGLEYRDAWTARELLERGRPAEDVARALTPLVRSIDAKTFGRDEVRREDVDEVDRLSTRLLGGGGGGA